MSSINVFASMPLILSIPMELLIKIFGELELRDLLRSQEVCIAFRDIIKDSIELQYQIELAADGMVDGPHCSGSLSTAERLRLLIDRRQRWRSLDWTRKVTVELPGVCQAYELVGGVFAKSMMSGAKHLVAAWLPTRDTEVQTIIREDLGFPTRDFAIDPTQDLIALVGSEARNPSQFKVHLRTISTNLSHPDAAQPDLEAVTPFQIGHCFVQIVEDVVGMFFWLNNPGLIIWNWRTGQQVVFRTGFDLPESTFDFAFISSRAFMITTTHGHGAIELYTFDAHLPPSIEALSLDGRPTHIVSLSFPEVLPGVTMRSFSTHSAPFLGGTSGQLKPFLTSQDDRIHLLSLNYGEVRRRFHLYLKNKFLLSLIPVGVGSSSQWPTKILSWEEWGPRHTRIHEHRNQFQWLRYAHGHRVVLPPAPVFREFNDRHRVSVLDFNVHPKRLDDPAISKMCVSDENEFVRTYDVITSATYVEAKEVFTKDVVSQLPYAVSTRTGTLDYTGFLIDEERLVGMKDAAFAEGHVSDIDVFTF